MILRLVCANGFFFFYFHIYITRCPLIGPNSKVAPFCILRTQKSRYCTFTKAPCFCKSRYDNNHKANESKGMVMSVSSAQTGLFANNTAYKPVAPVGTVFWGWDSRKVFSRYVQEGENEKG